MAQLTGTAGRSTSHTPVVFVAGTLFAVAAMATFIVLALSLGVTFELRDGANVARPGALAPQAPAPVTEPVDLRAAPGEFRLAPGNLQPVGVAPRAGLSIYDSRLDPIEQAYIDAARSGDGAGTMSFQPQSPAIELSRPHIGLPRSQLIPR